MSADIEALASVAIDCGFHIHKEIGPGLLESAYELLLTESLIQRGFTVQRQLPISLKANGIFIENAFRADIIINEILLIEVKSTEQHAAVHAKQLLTYLRLTQMPLGVLLNFGAATFKEGVRRIVNNYQSSK